MTPPDAHHAKAFDLVQAWMVEDNGDLHRPYLQNRIAQLLRDTAREAEGREREACAKLAAEHHDCRCNRAVAKAIREREGR